MNNTKELRLWTFAWILSMAIAIFGPQFLWSEESIGTLLTIIANLILGIQMILANRKFINSGDELQKKIHLESMSLTLGLAVIVGLSYSLLDQKNIISGDAKISVLVLFIGITYFVATIINNRKYK
jgi:peptidoglycan/LPS O-acetylase OafA/YrhL